MLARMRVMTIALLVACGPAPRAPISNRGTPGPARPMPPMLGEHGLRGHEDGSMPTKASIEGMLPGAVAHVTPPNAVVELAGVPQTKLVPKSIQAGIAMVIEDGGALITVFAPQVTMPHGLIVGMTLADARRHQPKLECTVWDPRIGGPPPVTPPPYLVKTCSLASSPHFGFHIHGNGADERIDYISFHRR